MKTVVIYSGQARSFAQVFPNQWFNVLRKLINPHIVVSVADDEQSRDMMQLLQRFPEERVHFEFVNQPEQPTPPADPKFLACYPPSSSPSSILKMFWSMERSWQFALDRVDIERGDTVIRMRCDLAFTRFIPPVVRFSRACYTPWWGRYGGENDRVAVMGYEAAQAYHSVFSERQWLREEGCPLHPETMLATVLRKYHINPSPTLAAEFIAVRTDGSTVGCDISAIDYAEYARA